MGCSDSTPEQQQGKQIDAYIGREKRTDKLEKKLLLLGAGSAGKSTIFKQLSRIHGNGFDGNEITEAAINIQSNCITGILQLLKQSQNLYDKDPSKNSDCYVPLEEDEVVNYIQDLVSLKDITLGEDGSESEMTKLGSALYNLWSLEPVKNTYKKRGGRFAFPENSHHFFNKVKEVLNPEYLPNDEDMLLARARTSGLLEATYELSGHVFKIFDVGGQRNERKKWIHAFEHVSAVIFVAALNHYNTVLFEDEQKNSMHESLTLFNEVCNSKWFRATEMILFLNKDDLFIEELRKGHSLSKCFNRGAFGWEGPQFYEESGIEDFRPTGNEELDNQKFEVCYKQSLKFITDQYLSRNRNKDRMIFTHVTNATNDGNVKMVFNDVQNIAIRSNLRDGGMMI